MKKTPARLLALRLALFGLLAVTGALLGASAERLPANALMPPWPAPGVPVLAARAPSIKSGDLEVIHSRDPFGGWLVRVSGRPMAVGQDEFQIGWMNGGELHWIDLARSIGRRYTVRAQRDAIEVSLSGKDIYGARWSIKQRFTPGTIAGALNVQTEARVDRDRSVAFLPMLMVFPGVGSFGEKKHQGLFAGLEYLENEPSSSEADLIGPASKRQVPDSLKITFPLMATEDDGACVALTWEPQPQISALFDSPDRLLGSGAHVMGLLFPGSDGKNRQEGCLLPRTAEVLRANQPLVMQATILGSKGASIVPAVEQYVGLHGLPPLPDTGMDLQKYVSLTAGGWLDSKIREGDKFRHAVGQNFHPNHAADAAIWMDWLANETSHPNLARRLEDEVKQVIAPLPPQDLNTSAIGHVRDPVATLVFGHVAENAERAAAAGRQTLLGFEADGSVRYHGPAGGLDLAKTHYSNEANGLTAASVLEVLRAAVFSGDTQLIEAALNRLRAMDKFRDGVPRGAQTWECPLHTPDILASAHLVRAYTLGYELTGERDFLDQARFWAWTGVPFVYLVNPASQPIGLYSTIAVFGATQWRAPVWLGLPVQWCGLVYADALYRLVRDDPNGPWKRLADGIALSGIAQTWPAEDAARQGLLPDSFVLRSQTRNAPPINPGTVQACAMQYFGRPVYGFWSFRENGLRVHAPGEIRHVNEEHGHVGFEVGSWAAQPYFVFVNGFTARPEVKIDGRPADLAGDNQFLKNEGWLILKLEGTERVDLVLGARGE